MSKIKVPNSTTIDFSGQPSSSHPPSRSSLFLILVAFLTVLVPFLFWYGIWFGRCLNDKQIEKYLFDADNPRKAQHALNQIAVRLERGDPKIDFSRWYPLILRLAEHNAIELRMTVAWFMGLEAQSEDFRESLKTLLEDSEPLVRRNAALSLVRFGDSSGRNEILRMLEPHILRAPQSGILSFTVKQDAAIDRNTLIARIQSKSNELIEIRSPIPGFLDSKLKEEGSEVRKGDPITLLSPRPEHVWEALRALYLVGDTEDLVPLDRYFDGTPDMPKEIQRQAIRTQEAIRSRGSQKE